MFVKVCITAMKYWITLSLPRSGVGLFSFSNFCFGDFSGEVNAEIKNNNGSKLKLKFCQNAVNS